MARAFYRLRPQEFDDSTYDCIRLTETASYIYVYSASAPNYRLERECDAEQIADTWSGLRETLRPTTRDRVFHAITEDAEGRQHQRPRGEVEDTGTIIEDWIIPVAFSALEVSHQQKALDTALGIEERSW